MDKTMTVSKVTEHRLLSLLLSAALGVAIAACGDDSGHVTGDTSPTTTADSGPVAVDAGPSVSTSEAGSDPGAATGCLGAVYPALSDGCKSCACTADPVLAPSCGKPCWDFLACSFVAQAGACAASSAGGAATRPEFEACTLDECGSFLAVPGAQVVSSYRPIIAACADTMGGAPLACTPDITKFISAIGK
jgi:hypothetical protein